MPRKNKNARNNKILHNQYSFTKICRLAGINPRQRVILRRYMLKNRGGGNNE